MNSLLPDRPNRISQLIRELQREVKRNKLLKSASIMVTPTEAGTVVETIRKGGGSGAAVDLYQITGLGQDTISAQEISFDPTTGAKVLSGTTVTIAKPYYLRVSPTNGTTVGGGVISFPDSNTKRTTYATLQGVANVVIDKVLTPPYAVGAEIWALSGDTSYTTGAAPNPIRTTLEDLNVDAREWLFPEQFVKVCINNVSKNMLIYGSAPF